MSLELALIESGGMLIESNFNHMMRVATVYSESDLVPDDCKKKPANCLIKLEMGNRLGIAPMMALQCIHVIHGKPGMSSTLAIALVNDSGKLRGGLKFKMSGEGAARACTAYATEKETGEIIEAYFPLSEAVAEGYVSRNPKWKSMTDTMLTYRAATRFARFYCPDRLMGMSTREEVEDISGEVPFIEHAGQGQPNGLAQQLLAPPKETVVVDAVEVTQEPIRHPKKPSKAKEKPDAVDSTPEPEKAPQTPSIDQIEADYKTWDEGKQAAFVDLVKTYKETMPREDAAVKAYLELA